MPYAYNNRGAAYQGKRLRLTAPSKIWTKHRPETRLCQCLFQSWQCLQKKDDCDGAIADYTKAIEFKPNNAIAHYFRGLVYMVKGEILVVPLQDFTLKQ